MAITVKDITTGVVVDVPDHYVGDPILGVNLVPVKDEEPATTPKKKTATVVEPATEENI